MRALWCVLIWVLLLASAPCGDAFQRLRTGDGKGLFWPKAAMPVPYVISGAGTPDVPGTLEFEAVQASFNTWQEVSKGEITFRYAGTTSQLPASRDGLNTAGYWVQWDWTLLNGGSSQDVIAATLLFWNDATGEILEADILCNGEYFQWGRNGEPDKMDIQAIMTHEIGHFLGLGEQLSDNAATMYPRTNAGETHKRDLSEDDILAVRTIYPNTATSLATRLYHVVLGRDPDPTGLSSWANFLDTTADFPAAAKGFLLSPEFLAWTDNTNFVTTLYRTVLYREPDPEGFALYLGLLDAGTISREALIDTFLNSEEFLSLQILP